MLERAMLMTIFAGFLSACNPPVVTERPVLDALEMPVTDLTRCVVSRDWACTTTATRRIVAIMDAAT